MTLTKSLSLFGLMRVSEHERAMSDRVSVALHNDVVNAFNERVERKKRLIEYLMGEIDRLRPDAEAMRAKRKRDRDMKAAKRGAK